MIRIGVAGWDYPDWEGIVFPSPVPRGFDRLGYLAGFLDVIELNVTFYRQPDPAAARSWARRVAGQSAFRFTAKLYRNLTHAGSALRGPGRGAARDSIVPESLDESAAGFREGIAPLHQAGRLLAVLAQFPQSFHDLEANRRHIERLAGLMEGLPLVAEFRHRSWDHEDALRFLHSLHVGFCNIDQPAIGSALRPTGHVTSRVAYVRLHGRNASEWFREGRPSHARYDYLYTAEELRPWSERVGRLAERAEEVVVIANNHYRGQAPANALMLKAMLARSRVPAPARLADAYRELAAVARPADRPPPTQRRLFE